MEKYASFVDGEKRPGGFYYLVYNITTIGDDNHGEMHILRIANSNAPRWMRSKPFIAVVKT